MKLRGQHGYAMAALLVGLAVMAVLMTVAMPTWRQIARREKEAELIFRGQQYARAIGLFQKKAGPGVLPPSVAALVDGRYLRRPYKDPITGQDFELLAAAQAAAPGPAGRGVPPGAAPTGRGGAPPVGSGGVGAPGSVARGGIMGVASKSKDMSIRIYNGRTHYNEWQFVYVAQVQAPGQGNGAPGGGQPQRGGQFQGQGQGRGSGLTGGVGRGNTDDGRGRGGRGPDAPFGRGNAQPPFGGGSSMGLPTPPRRD